MSQLGDLGDGVEIETGSLLRRQIARHCVYGVDKNRVAVELARLAIWVHTFVPGLPAVIPRPQLRPRRQPHRRGHLG